MKKSPLRIAASAIALSGALVLGAVPNAAADTAAPSHLSLRAVERTHSVVLKGKLFTGHPRVDGSARIKIFERGEGLVGRADTDPVGGFVYRLEAGDRGAYIAVFTGARYVERGSGSGEIDVHQIAPSRSEVVRIR